MDVMHFPLRERVSQARRQMPADARRRCDFSRPGSPFGEPEARYLLELRLDRLHLGRAFTLAHRLAKARDRAAQIRAQATQALGAEQHDDDQKNDQQLPDADTHHFAYLDSVECRSEEHTSEL